MSVCTFFGHRDCPPDVRPQLLGTVCRLIDEGVDTFYVGDSGAFDRLVRAVLREAQERRPHIRYCVVLSRLPNTPLGEDTLLPEGVELAPRRFAIDRRNRWMLKEADTVVCYLDCLCGGAAQYVKTALKRGKRVINLGKAAL